MTELDAVLAAMLRLADIPDEVLVASHIEQTHECGCFSDWLSPEDAVYDEGPDCGA